MKLWPRSLAGRTALGMAAVLVAAQVGGLSIYASDRADLLRLAQARDLGVRVMALYRTVALTLPDQRATLVDELNAREGPTVSLAVEPPLPEMPTPQPLNRLLHVDMQLVAVPIGARPKQITIVGSYQTQKLRFAWRLPDGKWLTVTEPFLSPEPWNDAGFLIAFALMTVAAVAVSVWASRRLVAPVGTLAAAADALGRDVATAPLPEHGPAEVALAARAFNLMAARIRRAVAERTFMLTAISHDLRTPITRLRLRAEFMDDEALRAKMLADLDELEALVSATLAFGRDSLGGEPAVTLDLAELLRSVLDDAADARTEGPAGLSYDGPRALAIQGRPTALRRAFANLIGNAVAYGGAARVSLGLNPVVVTIDDDGPGIPPVDRVRVMEPFVRLEGSRNRATGGIGLGLPIARELLRAQGWELSIGDADGGGARMVASRA